jgi:ribonuclease HI
MPAIAPARAWPAPSINLAIDPKAIAAYTDGSRINDPKTGASSIGAGVYMVYPARNDGSQAESSQRNPRVHRLDPTADHGYMNTITRAELCAIEGALNAASEQSEELHIYTDSQVSIALIKKYTSSPFYSAVAESKHSALLQRIAEAICLRAEKGYHTRIFKVRSHTGVEGNEQADKVAGEAAKGEKKPRQCPGAGDNPHGSRVWAATRPKASTLREGAPKPPPIYLSDLGKAARVVVAPTASTGSFGNTGLYATLWTDARPRHNGEASGSFHRDTGVTWPQRQHTMLARWGMLYNQKLAHRYGRAPNDQCPRCGQPDSVGHLLGGCIETQALRTARHDQAVKTIHRAISKNTLAGRFTIMDAGAEADLPEGVAGKRLPAWLFSPGADAEKGIRLRPDILLVSCPARGATYPNEERALEPEQDETKTIHIIEVGYSSDLSTEQKESEKHQQHQELEALLKKANPENTVARHTIILGRTGAIPNSLTTLLQSTVAHLSKAEALKVGRKLCKHAVQYVEKFVWARRAAAAQASSQPNQHTGAGAGGGSSSSSSPCRPSPPPRPQPDQDQEQDTTAAGPATAAETKGPTIALTPLTFP